MNAWYKYELWNGRTLVFVGATTDPVRRQYEHSRTKEFTRLKIIGRRTTQDAAQKWRDARIATYAKNHHKQPPRYNDDLFGDSE
jgi:hypothetical protein